jgi:hypothetical protein
MSSTPGDVRDGVVVQQRVVAQIVGNAQRPAPLQQARAAHRRVGDAEQLVDPGAGIAAVAEADGHQRGLVVGRRLLLGAAAGVDGRHRRGDAQLDVRVALGESVQPRHQPAGGEQGRRADRQRSQAGEAAAALDSGRERLECLLHLGHHCLAGVGELQRPGQPAKQLDPQLVLQRLHHVADGRRGDVQLRRRLLEAQVAGGGLEGAKRVQRWQAVVDHRPMVEHI